MGADARWTGLERSERETEVRFYLQSVKQKARDEEKARRKKELDALYAVFDGMALEPSARWSDKEAEVQAKFQGSVIAGKALRDLFYDYLDQLRDKREKEQKQRQKEFRQFLFDVLEKLLNENRIRPEFHWEEVEAVMTEDEKPRFPDVKLAPQPILNEFIDKVNNRVRFEEKVGVSRGFHVVAAGVPELEAGGVDVGDVVRGAERGGGRAAAVGEAERPAVPQRVLVPARVEAARGEAARRGALRVPVDAAAAAARGGGAGELAGEEGVPGTAGRVSVRSGASGVHVRGRGAAAEGEEAMAGGRGRGGPRAVVRRVLEGAEGAAGEGEGEEGEGEEGGEGGEASASSTSSTCQSIAQRAKQKQKQKQE